MAKLEVYQYPNCSTCRKALRWLDQAGVAYRSIHIVEAPPSVVKLKRCLKLSGKPVSKLFNTSGQLYREGNYKEKLKTLTEQRALEALASEGKLIKRPLVLGSDFALVGFKEAEYAEKLRAGN